MVGRGGGGRGLGGEGLSCTNSSISFFCLSGPEDVILRPSAAMTTWLLELSMTSLEPSIRNMTN